MLWSIKYNEISGDAVFMEQREKLKNFLMSNPVPFPETTNEGYEEFINVIISSDEIQSIPFTIIKYGVVDDDIARKKVKRVVGDVVIFENGKEERITKNISLSYILYSEKLALFEEIKYFTILEYIYRKIELC